MTDPDAYVSLVASLPSSERLFVAKRPPLSRAQLEVRLRALAPEDRAVLDRVESVLSWSSYGMSDDVTTVAARVKSAMAGVPHPTLRAIIEERMDMRTAIAALRMRAKGAPAPSGAWGLGRWTRTIAANWQDPTFRLDASLPWLAEAHRLMGEHDPRGLQKHILSVSYKQLQRHAGRHQFDLEAVVIYVLKWNIFDRWAKSNAEAAARRFSELSLAALSDFPDLTFEGEAT